ncbi:MAG: hypothetical protein N2555_05730 [Endomicrobia bacterium]|nr:hypothetical protein [Endomicrobiia bacterium]
MYKFLLTFLISINIVFTQQFSEENFEDIWQQQQETFDGVVAPNNPYVLQLRSILNQIEQISNQMLSLSKETMVETQPLNKQLEDINSQIEKLYQQLYTSYGAVSSQINAQIKTLESKKNQIIRQIDQIYNQKYNQLQSQLNKLQSMIPQVMAMIEQASNWENYPDKFKKFKDLKSKFEKAVVKRIKENLKQHTVAEEYKEKPTKQEKSQNYEPNVVDLSDKKNAYVALFEQPSYNGPLSKIEVPPPTSEKLQKSYLKVESSKDISQLESVVELTKDGLNKLQEIREETKQKILDFSKEKLFEKTLGKVPGVSLGKELIESFKENFTSLKEANENALTNVFKAASEASAYLAYGKGDIEFVISVDEKIAHRYTETAKKLIKENVSKGLEGYSGMEREPQNFSELKMKYPGEDLKSYKSFKIAHPDMPRLENHKQKWIKE